MKTQKMTNQVKAMVNEVNERMRYMHIKDSSDLLFSSMCWLLIQAKCYHGYNYFTVDGQLSGGVNDKFDHLELYVR